MLVISDLSLLFKSQHSRLHSRHRLNGTVRGFTRILTELGKRLIMRGSREVGVFQGNSLRSLFRLDERIGVRSLLLRILLQILLQVLLLLLDVLLRFLRQRGNGCDVLVSLCAVFTHVLLHDASSLARLGLRHLPRLTRMRVDHIVDPVDLLVDEALVAEVNQGPEVSDGHANEGQAPEWQKAHKPIGRQGGDEALDLLVSIKEMT